MENNWFWLTMIIIIVCVTVNSILTSFWKEKYKKNKDEEDKESKQ